jgi:hypothetical protein
MSIRAEVAEFIAGYRPSSVSGPAECFARDVVTRAAPATPARARALLWAAAKLADFSILAGLEPVPGVLLHPSVTGRFAVTAPGLLLPTSLSGDLAAALREHGSATLDEHYGHSHQPWPMPGLRCQHHAAAPATLRN